MLKAMCVRGCRRNAVHFIPFVVALLALDARPGMAASEPKKGASVDQPAQGPKAKAAETSKKAESSEASQVQKPEGLAPSKKDEVQVGKRAAVQSSSPAKPSEDTSKAKEVQAPGAAASALKKTPGAKKSPNAPEPARDPELPSREGQGAFVGTPLPPPPPSVPVAKIANGIWRGRFRLDAGLDWSVPLPLSGSRPASGDLYGFGFDFAASYRLAEQFALGARWGVSPHENVGSGIELRWLYDARVANRVALLARGYLPTQGRFQPFAELSAGLIFLEALAGRTHQQGGVFGLAVGGDFWVLPGWSLWSALRYRMTVIERKTGNRAEVALGVALHF